MKKLFLSVALIFCGTLLFSQVVVNPNADFYESAREWQVKGLVPILPQFAPYNMATIKGILDAVLENGSDAEKETAQYYYEKYLGKKWHAAFEAGGTFKASDSDGENKKFIFIEPSFYGDVPFNEWLTLGYDLGLNLHNDSTASKEVLSLFKNDTLDTWGDGADLGPLEGNWDMSAGLNIGNERLSGMVGANRISYSNIFMHDNIILNGLSYHMNNFSFSYSDKKWQYSQLLSCIAAGNAKGEFTADKYLAFHSVRFTPIRQLAISYFEAAIFGNRFDPSYLIPAPFILLQGMFDAGDNDIYGLQFEIMPFDGFEAAITFAIDDISVDDFSRGDFDSKFKAALQAGVVYSPNVDFLKKVSLDYTMVLPYMYSHWINSPEEEDRAKIVPVKGTEFNFQNYTNRGVCIGSRLPPNSDRVHLETFFQPVKRLGLNVALDYTRHGNETESWNTDEVLAHQKKFSECDNSGSADTDPFPKSVQEKNSFMKQSHLMHIVQLGLDASYEVFRGKYGVLECRAGYTFEFVHNRGVEKPIYIGSVESASQVQAAQRLWEEGLHNEINNYFSISAKYSY